jgi:hypothetical protein
MEILAHALAPSAIPIFNGVIGSMKKMIQQILLSWFSGEEFG